MVERNDNVSNEAWAGSVSPAVLNKIINESLGAVISLIDHDTRLLYVNERFASAFDTTARALIGTTLLELYDESHSREFMPYIRRALAGETVTYDRLGRVLGSSGVWHTVSLTPWRDEAGNILGVALASMRVHELKVTVEALRAANQRLASHMDNSPLGVIELDSTLNIIHCSAQLQDVMSTPVKEACGRALFDVLIANGAGAATCPLAGAFERLQQGLETRNRVEVLLADAHGRAVYCEWFNSALTDAAGGVSSIMSLVQNTTVRALAEAQLRQVATHDPLTGLRNRRALTEHLAQAAQRSKRTGEPLALLFIDLDGFKAVNDRFGHGVGDEVLVEVARRLLHLVRQSDVVARLGGDEFVLLVGTDVLNVSVRSLCDRIMAALAAPCIFAEGEAFVGASIGIALCPPLVSDAVELMRMADAAMYEAKRAGKGRIHFAEQPQPAATAAHVR